MAVAVVEAGIFFFFGPSHFLGNSNADSESDIWVSKQMKMT